MLASKNLLKPADGEPIISPSKDMVLGVYYLTMQENKDYERARVFADSTEVELAYRLGQVKLHENVRVRVETWYDDKGIRQSASTIKIVDTTVGRAIFNQILPSEVQYVNQVQEKGSVKNLIADVYEICGEDITTEVADKIKDIGFGVCYVIWHYTGSRRYYYST